MSLLSENDCADTNGFSGELDEQVYHHQSRMIERLKNVFYRLDVDLHEGKARGIVSKEDAMSGLRRYWPDKSDKHFEQLRNVGLL